MLRSAGKKYREIVNDLINNYFPELKGRKIFLFRYKFRTFWANAFWLYPFRIIMISPRAEQLDDMSLRGLLGHELSHHSIYEEKGWFKYLYTYPYVYLFSRRGIINEENTVDKLTIKKGLGKELYKLREAANQDKKHARVNYLYLSKEQISDYDGNSNKW